MHAMSPNCGYSVFEKLHFVEFDESFVITYRIEKGFGLAKGR